MIHAARTAPQALIFLRVDWSVPERLSRQAFLQAAAWLMRKHDQLGVEFFLMDEESQACQEWLATLPAAKIGPVGGGHAIGAGSVLWLEKGRLRDFQATAPGASEIVDQTVALWKGTGKPAHGFPGLGSEPRALGEPGQLLRPSGGDCDKRVGRLSTSTHPGPPPPYWAAAAIWGPHWICHCRIRLLVCSSS